MLNDTKAALLFFPSYSFLPYLSLFSSMISKGAVIPYKILKPGIYC